MSMPENGGLRGGMEGKDRKYFLDALRVAAACAVVLLHTVGGVKDHMDMSRYPAAAQAFMVTIDLTGWCVPVFLMISGYLFLHPQREIGMGEMFSKYILRVLAALFVFGTPYAWLELLMTRRSFSLSMLWQGVVMVLRGKSWAHMWYLYLILFLYLLTPAMKWVLKRLPRPLLLALLAALFLECAVVPFLQQTAVLPAELPTLPQSGIYLFYYLAGFLFAQREKREQKAAVRGLIFSCIMLAALAGIMVFCRLFVNGMPVMAYHYPPTVLFSLGLFQAASLWESCGGVSAAGFWKWASGLCFGVYLIHPLFINIEYKLLHLTPLSFPVWLSVPGFFLWHLFLSFLAAWLLKKIPFLRKYVL